MKTVRVWFEQINQVAIDVTVQNGTEPAAIVHKAATIWRKEFAQPYIVDTCVVEERAL